MAYEIFPDNISRGSSGGPAFAVDVTGNDSQEWRTLLNALPRYEFEVAHAAQTPDRYLPLQKFFLNHCGRWRTFRYLDPLDNTVASGEGAFVDISDSQFQMRKLYVYGSLTFYRTITKPIEGTVVVTGGTVDETDYDTGIVTMVSGTPTSWTGSFHTHARFNVDRMVPTLIHRRPDGSNVVTWQTIPVVEVKAAT
jgi:uncharacterized protein (TIGR02217 family)